MRAKKISVNLKEHNLIFHFLENYFFILTDVFISELVNRDVIIIILDQFDYYNSIKITLY